MAASKFLIVGNWKSNGSRQQLAVWVQAFGGQLGDGITAVVDILVCPPAVYLDQMGSMLPLGVSLGAQDVSATQEGAYTGEVTARMLGDSGCSHVIVGHSERRRCHAETDSLVAQKYLRAQQAGLVPIVAVGETAEERQAGKTELVLRRQIEAILEVAGGEFAGVVAYEPVWAIGTGDTATPAQAGAVHGFIRSLLRSACQDADAVPLLYGGSVNSEKVADLLDEPEINGALVGGASLDGSSFATLCRNAARNSGH